jgi:hypothetical protein
MNRTQRFVFATGFVFAILCAAALRPSSGGHDWIPILPLDGQQVWLLSEIPPRNATFLRRLDVAFNVECCEGRKF